MSVGLMGIDKERLQRLNEMLAHALAGDRKAFDGVRVFGEIDKGAAEHLWRAGRALALS